MQLPIIIKAAVRQCCMQVSSALKGGSVHAFIVDVGVAAYMVKRGVVTAVV